MISNKYLHNFLAYPSTAIGVLGNDIMALLPNLPEKVPELYFVLLNRSTNADEQNESPASSCPTSKKTEL